MTAIFNLKDTPQYLNQLAVWHHSQWSYLNPEETLNHRVDRMQSFLSDGLIPSTFIAAEKELMGSAALVVNDMDTKPHLSPWLASVFVAPKYRRRGIGTELVSYIMKQAKLNDICILYLFTPDMAHFYRKLGWQSISQEIYHGQSVSIMKIDLSELKI